MNKLKELRQEKKLTQKELADIAEVSKRTYIYWESGGSQIKPDKTQTLADFYGVSVGYLLGYTNNRFGASQITKAIENKLDTNDSLNKEVLESTMKIIELSDFLDMDLETLSNIYFYNLKRTTPIQVLSDLFDFFDAEARDYKELLSIVEPYQADEVMQEISKLGDYKEELSLYLNKIRAEKDDEEARNRIEETYLRFITDLERLRTLKSDTLVAIRFIESIQNNLHHGTVKPYSYAWEMEKISSQLLDLLDRIDQRENELTED